MIAPQGTHLLRSFFWGVLFILAPALMGCSTSKEISSLTNTSPSNLRKGVQLTLPAQGIPVNEFFELRVGVESPGVQHLRLDADMPAHGHGMIVNPQIERLDATTWLVRGMKFHMPGFWEIYVDLETDQGLRRVMFPMEINPW